MKNRKQIIYQQSFLVQKVKIKTYSLRQLVNNNIKPLTKNRTQAQTEAISKFTSIH